MNYKELFIDKDDILLIRKELVRILGDLNEAVILNQLYYWIEINRKAVKNYYDDRYWVFNTYQTWKETDFDFWSTDTIRRTLTRLENKGIVLTANYNKLKIDKTKWYTIDYKKLQELIDEYEKEHNAIKENADCGHDMANCTDGNGNIISTIPENSTKNTSEKKERNAHAREVDTAPSQSQFNTTDWPTLKLQLITAMRELGYKTGARKFKTANNTFVYYATMCKRRNIPLPKLTDTEILLTAKAFLSGLSKVKGNNEYGYKSLIDEYFESGYGESSGWSILDFMTKYAQVKELGMNKDNKNNYLFVDDLAGINDPILEEILKSVPPPKGKIACGMRGTFNIKDFERIAGGLNDC